VQRSLVRSFVRSFICSLRSLELNFATLRCYCARARARARVFCINTALDGELRSIGTIRLATISGFALPTLRGARHADVRYN
jgi:hypothetical protein